MPNEPNMPPLTYHPINYHPTPRLNNPKTPQKPRPTPPTSQKIPIFAHKQPPKTHNTIKKSTQLTLIIAIMALTARAISYDDARQQAWFITDKMAYELNLTPEQYDRAYQINLDYLMSLNGPTDITGAYWQYRDIDLRCILFDWQYNLLSTLDYFYRPVRWYATRWYYPVYDHYRIGYYYYTRPNIYITYHGCTWHRRRPDRPSPYASWRPRRGAGMHGYGPATPPPPTHYNHPGHHNRPDNNYNWPYNNGHPDHPYNNNNGNYNHHNRPDRPNNYNHPDRPNNNNSGNYNHPDRPYNNNNGNYGRPGRPNNNNNNSGARPAFRDTYINYRQTGHDTPQRGTGRPTSTRSGRGFGQR